MRCNVFAPALALVTLPLLQGCSVWFFSGESWVDRSQPVALLETTGGVEYAATTEFGVLSLGATADAGPCRVRYLLGDTPLVEEGTLQKVSDRFVRAEIDLKTQLARALDRAPTADDRLWVMWTPDGRDVETVSVDLARGPGLEGDLLEDPGVALPGGATLLCRGPNGEAMFAGMIAGVAAVDSGPATGRYYVFAGVDRVRELLAVPHRFPIDLAPKYRSDGISVMKPVEAQAPSAGADPTAPPSPVEPPTPAGAPDPAAGGGGGD
jgi:hypothetical protein